MELSSCSGTTTACTQVWQHHICSGAFEGCDRTCASLSNVGFLQVTELRLCCRRGGGGGKGSAAQAVRDVRVFEAFRQTDGGKASSLQAY